MEDFIRNFIWNFVWIFIRHITTRWILAKFHIEFHSRWTWEISYEWAFSSVAIFSIHLWWKSVCKMTEQFPELYYSKRNYANILGCGSKRGSCSPESIVSEWVSQIRYVPKIVLPNHKRVKWSPLFTIVFLTASVDMADSQGKCHWIQNKFQLFYV